MSSGRGFSSGYGFSFAPMRRSSAGAGARLGARKVFGGRSTGRLLNARGFECRYRTRALLNKR